MSETRVGVFGGTFDPVHTGHLLLAETALSGAALSRVLFMPAHIQPFKQDAETSSDDDRLRMLRLAVRGNPAFDVTAIETEKGGVSYTIDSLRELRERSGGARLCFIIGTDMFLMIEKWKEADALAREFDFAVGIRPEYRHDEALAMAETLRKTHGTRVDFVDNPPVALSSTDIRRRVRDGESIRYRVPEAVRRYLLVRAAEGEERFSHTKRVMDLASEMALRFGEPPERAELAALLHDIMKDPAGGAENDVKHGAMAADAAARRFGVTDADVLNAIRYHTTGRSGMSRLELIVFLADTVEPGREYDSVDRLRGLCMDDLERGALTTLSELARYLEKKGLETSPDTLAAIADLRERTNARL